MRCADIIIFMLMSLGMISSINLNNQVSIKTNEICYVITYNMLTQETISKSTIPHILPKHIFSQRSILPVFPGICLQHIVSIWRSSPKHSNNAPPLLREGAWGESLPHATLFSFLMMEKMKRAATRQMTMRVPHTRVRSIPHM